MIMGFSTTPDRLSALSKNLLEEQPLHEALQTVYHMHQKGLPVSSEILSRLLQRCISKDYLELGRNLHRLIMRGGRNTYFFLGNHLIRMFSLCGSLPDATHVFRLLPRPNVYAWGAIISAHSRFGQDDQAIQLFHQMQQSPVYPDGHVFVAILKACSHKEDFVQGRLVHLQVGVHGLDSNLHVGSSLIDMYSRCGSLDDACNVFDRLPEQNTVTWSALISGHVLHGCGEKAFKNFQQMLWDGIEPDKVTLLSMVKASTDIADLDQSTFFHFYINECGFESLINIGNALVDMYSKFGSLENARRVFDRLLNRDMVTWSSIIAGYAQHEHGEEALLLYQQMQQEGLVPNSVTFVCLIRACSSISALPHGKLIHGHIIRSDCSLDLFVGNALVDMYAKCGSPEDAYIVFTELPKRNLVTWNAMIAGYAECGDYKLAKWLYEGMREQGLKPNSITFLCLLGACSQEGLVEEGCGLFNSMREDHHITPALDLYSCMVDILGRAGCLLEAKDLVQTMPCQPSTVMWMCLLSQCRMHGNVDMGRRCFECVVAGDHRHASGYMLMLDMYAKADMWKDVQNVKELRASTNAWKRPGGACIELNREVYNFLIGDRSHPQSVGIYAELRRLQVRMKEEGYVP